MDGTIPLYPAMVALILAPEYFMPIRDFGTDYHATLNGKNAMTAIWKVIDQPLPTDTHVLPAFKDGSRKIRSACSILILLILTSVRAFRMLI